MNGNLLKIIIISSLAVLLAIIGGLLAGDGDPVTLALVGAPFVLAGIALMKEKVWYLWILLPAFFIPLGVYRNYAPLLSYCVTIPFYLWYALTRRKELTWNSIPLLDFFVFLVFLHVGILFCTHPFGLGVSILEDYYGGKGYIMFLQGAIAYLCLSSLKTSSDQLGKVLQWFVYLTIFFTLVQTSKFFLFPDSMTAEVGEDFRAAGGSDSTRNMTFLGISTLLLQVLVIRYSVWDILKKPWALVLACTSSVGILVSGFRSAVAGILFIFIIICLLYKRWFFVIVAPILGLALLFVLSSFGTLKEMPFAVQRALSPIAFLDVSPQARGDAEGSADWRIEMWKWALDDRENFIQDKVWGDGFAKNIAILKGNIYEEAYGLVHNQVGFAWNGLWHSGPVSTINTIGYVGLTLYVIISIIGMGYAWIVSRIYKDHENRLGVLFITVLYLVHPFTFLFICGDSVSIHSDIISLGIIKVLYSCAKREGLYVKGRVVDTYIPLIIRREQEAIAPRDIPGKDFPERKIRVTGNL